MRLSRTTLPNLPSSIARPAYDRQACGVGIVHLGIGAFHRAHQAIYTDDALAAAPGNWGICGVSLRSPAVRDALSAQDGLYSLAVKSGGGDSYRICGAVKEVICAPDDPAATLDRLTDPAVRIVSLTVTEKAYYRSPGIGGLQADDPDILHDLEHPKTPKTALGYLVEALARRRARGTPAFTVLCCDNLPNNGASLAAVTAGFARLRDPGLADWITANVAFPATMVDRIVPATTDADKDSAAQALKLEDTGAVVSEPFTQWVIEDVFPTGRPAWEAGGALFVTDIAPYEQMKLRMLNGSHSLIAYAGYLSGCTYVRDAMADRRLAALVGRHLAAAAATLTPLDALDYAAYGAALVARFTNPAIAHETYQIAMDGTEKIPQRLLVPAMHALQHGQDVRPFAFAVAAWMRYCLGRTDDGQSYDLRDPLSARIGAVIAPAGDAPGSIVNTLQGIGSVFPAPLVENDIWRAEVTDALSGILDNGMAAAIDMEAARTGATP